MMCFCGSRKEDIMYQKNYVLLLVSMVICTIMLWFSRVYMVQGEEKDTEQTAAHCVDMQGYETSSECRNIALGVLEPAYVINVSAEDVEVLMRIVEAEAGGEDRKGKLLVANVVINRVKDSHFPDTVTQVVYQRNSKVAQFSPVSDGRINCVKVSEETKEAVYSALYGEDVSKGALYFMARNIANPDKVCWFDNNLTLLFSYGGHDFFL